MAREDRQILARFAEGVRSLEPAARIWAYGSGVRGEADEYSDLDVCVVLPDPSSGLRRRIQHLAWEAGFEYDRVVQVVVLSEYGFERGPMSVSPLVRTIREQGIAA